MATKRKNMSAKIARSFYAISPAFVIALLGWSIFILGRIPSRLHTPLTAQESLLLTVVPYLIAVGVTAPMMLVGELRFKKWAWAERIFMIVSGVAGLLILNEAVSVMRHF